MTVTLEDAFGDIIRKARFGQRREAAEVAACAGMSVEDLQAAEAYKLTPAPATLAKLADCLGLDGAKLQAIADNAYAPAPLNNVGLPYDLHTLTVADETGFESNCHMLVWRETRDALMVDPGAQADRLIEWVQSLGATLRVIAITHGHGDHIGALRPVMEWSQAEVWLPEGDMDMIGHVPGRQLKGGETLPFAGATITVGATPGHTPGGIVFVTEGAAFVGDVLFAGSLGRANTDYVALRSGVRAEVLALPGDTRLMPGHGPNTTVGEEKRANPFFFGPDAVLVAH